MSDTGLDAHPDIVQAFMEWAQTALTSFPRVLCSLPQHMQGLLEVCIMALELQERVGLQKSIQLFVSGSL